MQNHLQQWTVPIVWMAGVATLGSPAYGQIVPTPEGTGTTVVQGGDVYDISGGTRAGDNLFHQFESLSLDERQAANFQSDSTVANIVGQVSGLSPSYIDGIVQVQGSDANLYLVNPAGVMFGPNARLSLSGSFAATTADQVGFDHAWLNVLENTQDYSEFTADPSAFRFTAENASAVVNQGDLAVAAGESLTLMGGSVVNTGRLNAPGGEIGLVAVGGDRTARFAIPGSLLSLEMTAAEAGQSFSATSLPALITGSPRESAEVLRVNADGSVTLSGAEVAAAGDAGQVAVSGEVSTRAEGSAGGVVALLGETVDLLGATVDASGDRGGTIRVGGDYQGQGNLPSASQTRFDARSFIRADGQTGAGGHVVLWADDLALAQGSISAQGATIGGFVETSAHSLDISGLRVNASGQTGKGSWLVDPDDIAIVTGANGSNQIDPLTITNQLDLNTDVTITTSAGMGGNGDISLLSNIDQLGGGSANLTLTGRRFSTNGSQINLTSTGQLRFDINAVNPEANPTSASIGSAIAAIGSVNGDRLLRLGAGTYGFADPVAIDTNVSIEGAGIGNTVLNAQNANRVFNVLPGAQVNLREMTLSSNSSGALGGGIRNQGNLTVENSRFSNNRALSGGAINSANGSKLTILGSEFISNVAINPGGGAIAVVGTATTPVDVLIDNAVFTINQSVDDGGALRISDGEAIIRNTRFENNLAGDDGGAVAVRGSGTTRFDTVSFSDNTAQSGGGTLMLWDQARIVLDNSQLIGSQTTGHGGGVLAIGNSSIDVNNSRIFGNSAGLSGGAFYIDDSELNISDSLISFNTTQTTGGGIQAVGSQVALNNSNLRFNEAVNAGGGLLQHDGTLIIDGGDVSFNQSDQSGGGLGLSGSVATTIGGNALFSNNTAMQSGGALATNSTGSLNISSSYWGENHADVSGGALYKDTSATVTIASSTFADNTAGLNGGGLNLRGSGTTNINSSTLSRNVATGDGGALHLVIGGSANLTNTIITQNQAGDQGGGIFASGSSNLSLVDVALQENQAIAEGGGLVQYDGTLTITGGNISHNHSDRSGGGVALSGDVVTTIDGAQLLDNSATQVGGALATNSTGSLDISNSYWASNHADGAGGALYKDTDATVTATSDTFIDNTAGTDGGAFSLLGNGATHIQQATLLRNAANGDGGALYQLGGGGVSLTNVAIEDSQAGDQGGGIYQGGSSDLSLSYVALRRNRAGTDGGGIMNNSADGALTIGNSGFDFNVAGAQGGAIASLADSVVQIANTGFRDNEAETGDGGAIHISGNAGLAVSASDFIRNAADNGGAIYSVANRSVSLTDVTLANNTATASGGAITHGSSSGLLTVSNARFNNNTSGNDGGGIATFGTTRLSIDSATFNGNVSGDDGGGVSVTFESVATIDNSSFENNRATDRGGGVYSNNLNTGFINDKTTIANSRFIGNEATTGGGFYQGLGGHALVQESLFQGNRAAVDGGAVAVSTGTAILNNLQFIDNQAAYGAGLELSSGAVVTASDSQFTTNRATMGGGIQVDDNSRLTLSNSTFEGNQADYGGALINYSVSELTNTTLSGNVATYQGGGIYTAGANAQLAVYNSTLSANQAGQSGGGIVESGSQSAELLNSIVAGNTSPVAADLSGRFVDQGNNLVGQIDGATGFSTSSLVGTAANPLDARLAPLSSNGGLTRTHLLLAGSPALNAGQNRSLPLSDQRGLARVVGGAVDIGAVELTAAEQPVIVSVTPVSLPLDKAPLSGQPSEVPPPRFSLDRLNVLTGDQASQALLASDLFFSDARLGREPGDSETSANNFTIRRVEQSFNQSFEDYWDLSAGPTLSFDDVQAVLRRAQEEYKVNSAVIYAEFVSQTADDAENILQVESEPAADDLLELALVLPEGELVRHQLPVTRAEAEQQVRLLRSTVADVEDDLGYRPLAQQLYEWLLAPLETDLAAQGIQNLMYALDAGLRNAPISAMRDSAGFALERYGISVVPSVGLMQADFPVAVRRSTVAMGVAQFEDEMPLPAVPVELEVVKDFVPASQTLLNEGTTLEALANVQLVEQPGILHLATHATFDPNSPESSYIQLWDQPLSMKEFSTLDWGSSNLELLILSACSTALSSPNAELGFAGLAAAAGVDATLGSLWQVSDVGTLALMGEFYAQLESTDLRFEAIRRAQLSLMRGETRIENGNLLTQWGETALPDEWDLPETATLEHPFYWSAFTMVGNPW